MATSLSTSYLGIGSISLTLIVQIVFTLALVKLVATVYSLFRKRWDFQKLSANFDDGGLETTFFWGNLKSVSTLCKETQPSFDVKTLQHDYNGLFKIASHSWFEPIPTGLAITSFLVWNLILSYCVLFLRKQIILGKNVFQHSV